MGLGGMGRGAPKAGLMPSSILLIGKFRDIGIAFAMAKRWKYENWYNSALELRAAEPPLQFMRVKLLFGRDPTESPMSTEVCRTTAS